MPSSRQRARGADCEEHVRGLGLAIGQPRIVGSEGEVEIVEDHRREHVAAGADGDDPGAAVGGQGVVEAEGQGEVTEVVGRELELPALARVLLRRRHDAGVVDEDVQRAVPPGHERGDRRPIGELERRHVDVAVPGGGRDAGGDPPAGLHVPHGQGDPGAGAGQRPRRLHADAGGRAGDDGPPARQVDAGCHLGRGGPGPEGRPDKCHHLLRRPDAADCVDHRRGGGNRPLGQRYLPPAR